MIGAPRTVSNSTNNTNQQSFMQPNQQNTIVHTANNVRVAPQPATSGTASGTSTPGMSGLFSGIKLPVRGAMTPTPGMGFMTPRVNSIVQPGQGSSKDSTIPSSMQMPLSRNSFGATRVGLGGGFGFGGFKPPARG